MKNMNDCKTYINLFSTTNNKNINIASNANPYDSILYICTAEKKINENKNTILILPTLNLIYCSSDIDIKKKTCYDPSSFIVFFLILWHFIALIAYLNIKKSCLLLLFNNINYKMKLN